ncbi:hypothetical protein ACVWXF_002041 [Thermostichus sp. MS-CIW-40]
MPLRSRESIGGSPSTHLYSSFSFHLQGSAKRAEPLATANPPGHPFDPTVSIPSAQLTHAAAHLRALIDSRLG